MFFARARHRERGTGVVVSLVLTMSLGLTACQPTTDGLGRPHVPKQRVSKVKKVGLGARKVRQQVANEKKTNDRQAKRAKAEQKVSWPKSGKATLHLGSKHAGKASPAGVPVNVTAGNAGGQVRVSVLDQKAAQRAGITGVVVTAAADSPGPAQVSVDYGSFASAVGGGWAGRLGLVQLPACVLNTPQQAQCRVRTPLHSRNDVGHHTVSAPLTLAGSTTASQTSGDSGMTVLAVTATGSGESPSGSGNYSATKLSPSSSWEAGSSSGAFTWNYDFTVPPSAGKLDPDLSLSYDSGSVDGRNATTNNQTTTVGEGFTLSDSYVERSYDSCDDDGQTGIYDMCWKYDNARLVLDGKATRLIKDSSSGEWRLADDDASKVIHSTGADNGDDNGEYWTVITGDGTKYVFGLNKLDGATTERTNSTWTVPVFGDDSGEPGYSGGSTFADRSLTQAWRWNLDYVEDTDGNAETYWYSKETNYYPKDKASTANAAYDRGGYLTQIKYGLRKGALFTDTADDKVTFDHAERCTASDCSSLTQSTADNWPDVPFDAICSSGDSDCNVAGPSFFTRKRLIGINTYSWSATSNAYDPVDSWALTEEYLDGGDIGDSSDQSLTLKSITRTGKAGTDITTNPISFTYHMLHNRVDATDDILPLTRPRISTITSETGAITTVTLSPGECVRSEVMGSPEDSNTRSCYPLYWHINGSTDASIDWFNKYRVLAVTTNDPTGNNDAVEDDYDYSGAAWRYDDDPMVPKAERTWSEWRGYRQVTVYKGAPSATRSKTVSLYMQGMNGDKQKDGTTRSVSLAPLSSPNVGIASITDSDQYAGQLREEVTYDGATAITVDADTPWSQETARQTVPNAADQVARYVRTSKTTTYTYLTVPKTWRSETETTTFDGYGMPVTVDDSGEVGKSGDQTCTRTWYARNPSIGLTNLVSRKREVGQSCSVSDANLSLPADSTSREDVLSDTATVYDDPNATGWSASRQPTKGDATWEGRASGYASTPDGNGDRNPSGWQTTATTGYDALGRVVSTTDAAGNTTTTAYTPATAGPTTETVVTDPKQFKDTTFLDPRRGQPLRRYDPNLKKTELTYDALGRLTQVWLPDRSSSSQSPNEKFAYQLSSDKPSWVSTSTLEKDGSSYNTTYAIYDALLRPLQTQSPTPQGGRLLTDTRYDSRGLVYETYANIFDKAATPDSTYQRAEYGGTPTQNETVFDGAERAISTSLYVFGVKKWTTTTTYTGDSTATTALAGGSATRTITDVREQTVESREYDGPSPDDQQYGASTGASYASTKFTYTLDGQRKTVTGPDGAGWSYGYDLYGRQTSASDPDKGTTTTKYNALDQATESTDSRGDTVLTKYDEIGRVTGTWHDSIGDANQLTGYTYDAVLKNQPDSSTRYVGGKNGAAYTNKITVYDSLSRPTTTQLILPATDPLVQAGTPSTLEFTRHYNVDGTLQNETEPALGGLPSETIGLGYTDQGQVTSISGSTGYLLNTDYSSLGQPQQLTLGTSDDEAHKKTYITNTYEDGTDRLIRSHVTDQTHAYELQDLNYTFDDAGNVTSIADNTTLGGTAAPDTQCFSYDGHRRLTEAWTPASGNCTDARDATALGGPAQYWNSYTYKNGGQRATDTKHVTSGATTTSYCYADNDQPHTLTGTSTEGDCAKPDRAYSYDSTGNTTSRPAPTGGTQQTLTWSEDSKLTKLTEGGTTTDYLYGADGDLLIENNKSGERILYAGATELHLKSDGTTWAQRTYAAGGLTVAVRSNETGTNTLHYLAADQHGTQDLAIDSGDTQQITKRYKDPFGNDRGTPIGFWPSDTGFLGKVDDPTTGLTHLDAREYDPRIGQFISVDPVLAVDKPQSLNGYSYAENNPETFTDPTGLMDYGTSDCGIRGDCNDGGSGHHHKHHKHHKHHSSGGTHHSSGGGGGNPYYGGGGRPTQSGGAYGHVDYYGGGGRPTQAGGEYGPDRINEYWDPPAPKPKKHSDDCSGIKFLKPSCGFTDHGRLGKTPGWAKSAEKHTGFVWIPCWNTCLRIRAGMDGNVTVQKGVRVSKKGSKWNQWSARIESWTPIPAFAYSHKTSGGQRSNIGFGSGPITIRQGIRDNRVPDQENWGFALSLNPEMWMDETKYKPRIDVFTDGPFLAHFCVRISGC